MKKLTTALLLSLFTFSIAQAEETKQVMLKVNEMNCQLCAYLVNKELRNIDGVISTKASIKDRTVTVVEDPKVSDEQLINAIHKLEYTAEVVKQSGKKIKVRSKLTALFYLSIIELFNHATCHTWAATAKWSWMI